MVSEEQEKKVGFMKNILHIYALLICLITTVILIVSFSLLLNFLTNLVFPELRYASDLGEYDSNESYIQCKEKTLSIKDPELGLLKTLTPEQVDAKRTSEKRKFLIKKRSDNLNSLFSNLSWIIVASLFFFIHWRLYKRASKT